MLDQQINEQLGLLQQELSRLKKAADYIDGARENSTIIVAELEGVQKNYTVYTDKILSLYRQYADDLKKGTEIQINDGVLKFEATGNRIDTTNREKLVETKRLLEQYSKLAEATDKLVGTLETVDFPERLSGIGTAVQSVRAALGNAQQSIEDKQAENQTALLERLDRQDGELQSVRAALGNAQQSIEDKQAENQTALLERLDWQDGELQSVRAALGNARQSIEDKQAENQTALLERLDRQDGDMKLLRMVLFIVCGLIIAGAVATIFVLK